MSLSRSVLLAVSLVSLAAAACGGSADDGGASGADQALTNGAQTLASSLTDPGSLTAQGDNVFFTTTYGFATQEEAEYHHDIWVKNGTARAKRLYKNLYGATWGLQATKNGLYEINEGYASLVRYPLDGSKPDGDSLYHAIYGHEEQPEVGIVQLAADDVGVVIALRSDDGTSAPGDIVALGPDGKNEKKLGSVPGAATALTIDGGDILVGTATGDVLRGARDGSHALAKVASVTGSVTGIVVAGGDLFVASDKGLGVKRASASGITSLVGEGTGHLATSGGQLFFAQGEKGVFSLPLAGGTPKQVLDVKRTSSILPNGNGLFVTDAALGACHDEEEGEACTWEGVAYRVAL